MKSRNPRLHYRDMPNQPTHALAHLSRRLIRERNREDRVRRNPVVLDEMCDAMRDHTSLARARTSQDQQRPVHGLNSFSLLRIESIEVQVLSLKEEAGIALQSKAEKERHGSYVLSTFGVAQGGPSSDSLAQ